MNYLKDNEAAVAKEVIAYEETQRRHLVIALSGAHAYGFPSPDSDLDLKAIHIESTAKLLGFTPPKDSSDRLEFVRGVEIDYTSNEIGGVLKGILAGNGNYIERVLGALIPHSSPEHLELKALLPRLLSKRVYHHYRGFASGQRKAFASAEAPSAKKLLYVLRTALTGTHLLREGELRVDITSIAATYGYSDVFALVETKKRGETAVLSLGEAKVWNDKLDALFELLDSSYQNSALPEEPSTEATLELEQWLLNLRRQTL